MLNIWHRSGSKKPRELYIYICIYIYIYNMSSKLIFFCFTVVAINIFLFTVLILTYIFSLSSNVCSFSAYKFCTCINIINLINILIFNVISINCIVVYFPYNRALLIFISFSVEMKFFWFILTTLVECIQLGCNTYRVREFYYKLKKFHIWI